MWLRISGAIREPSIARGQGLMAVAGMIALVALAAVVTSLGWLHLQPTRLSPLRDPVSQYGITAFRAGYRVATIAFAVAGVALAIAIDQATSGKASATIWLLGVFATARAAISWFPMDPPGAQPTAVGQVHGLLAIAAFASATAAALKLAGVLSPHDRWHSLQPASRTLGAIMLACLIAMALARWAPAARARFGAIERGFYLATIAWFTVFAIASATSVH